jgi:aquaporin Z
VLGKGAAVDLGPRPGFSVGAAMLVEVLYTAMICFVFLNVAASRGNNPLHKANGFVGLAVAFCFLAGGYGAAAISGTVMNPATAIGMQLVDFYDGHAEGWGFTYLPFEVAGACLAAGTYRLVRPGEFTNRMSQRWTPGAQAAIFQQAPLSARLAAEFVGTFYVVFTKALNHLGNSSAEAWSVGAAYGCMAYALRGVSGGHFNPAVSFASALTSRRFLAPLDCVRYTAVQVWAGLAASAAFAFLNDGSHIKVEQNEKYSWWSAAVGELLFTFLLAYANLATSVGGTMLAGLQSNVGGIAVGFAAVAGGLSLEGISGAVMNPAMAVGFSGLNALAAAAKCSVQGVRGQLASCNISSHPVLHYAVFEMSGALLAAAAFQVTHGRLLRSGALEDDAEKEPFSGREGSPRERL